MTFTMMSRDSWKIPWCANSGTSGAWELRNVFIFPIPIFEFLSVNLEVFYRQQYLGFIWFKIFSQTKISW